MKRKILLLLLTLAGLQACNLDLAPENVMVDQNVYSHAKTSQAALTGAYVRSNIFLGGAPEDQNNYSHLSFCWIAGDVGTDNLKVRKGASSDCVALEECTYDNKARDGAILSTWIKGYNAIDYANNIIDGVARYGSFEEELMARFVAEARFVRAFVYFNLLKMFGDGALTGNEEGLGLILRDKPYDGYNPDQIMNRSTVGDTWKFILTDLEAALDALPDNPGTPETRCVATKPVVWALLSRVYLYKGSYKNDKSAMAKAAEYARKVLECGAYSISTVYNDHRNGLFPDNPYAPSLAIGYPDPSVRSNEIILYQPSRISTEKYSNGVSPFFFQKRDAFVDPSWLKAQYLPGDLRGFVEGSADAMVGVGGTSYYAEDLASLKYSNNAGYDDLLYIRLSEIKLNLAEALTRESGAVTEAALKELNDVRCKPFAPADKPTVLQASDFPSAAALLEEILAERNRELAFESHRRWDLIRTGGKLRNTSVGPEQMILPIPDYEENISKGKIQQNTAFR